MRPGLQASLNSFTSFINSEQQTGLCAFLESKQIISMPIDAVSKFTEEVASVMRLNLQASPHDSTTSVNCGYCSQIVSVL